MPRAPSKPRSCAPKVSPNPPGSCRGESAAIRTVINAIQESGPDAATVAYQYYTKTIPAIAEGNASKVWVVPSELTASLGRFGAMLDAPPTKPPRPRAGLSGTEGIRVAGRPRGLSRGRLLRRLRFRTVFLPPQVPAARSATSDRDQPPACAGRSSGADRFRR